MARIFISYSSKERAEALSIQHWLEQNGWEDDVFVDVDPEHGLRGGEGWRDALRDAAGRCEAVILLLSRAWLASKPCWNEFLLAEKYGKPCIPIRIDEGLAVNELPAEIANNYQVIQKVATSLSEFEIRLKRALEAAGAGPENFPLPANCQPYPGLNALTETDAALLFGRDADVLAALDTLREVRSTGRRRLFVILGASGAGKSSLMRAGLWPRLNRDDHNFIALPTIRPANAILSGKQGLWQALETACSDIRRSQHLSTELPRTRAAIRLAVEHDAEFLLNIFTGLKQAAIHSFVDTLSAQPSVVLFIDQGEELYNSEGALEVASFFRLLTPIWERDSSFILVIAIRSDVYPRLQADNNLPQNQLRPFNLSPMSSAGLLKVIEGPAIRLGFQIEPALTAKLLEDSEGADTLPLLAFTLERLYEERLNDKQLGLVDYSRLGGVKGAIEVAASKARAEALAAGVNAANLDRLLRRTFLPHLARVNEAGAFARRVANLAELDVECLPLVNVLVNQRLLITDQRGELRTLEIAHEAILREWPLLTGWLDAERGFLEWREQIGRARKLHERNEGDLLTGRSLVIAQGFLEARLENISESDKTFIQVSLDAEQQRLAQEQAEQQIRQQAELTAAKAREDAAIAAAEAEKKIADTAQKSSRKMRRLAVLLGVLASVTALAGYFAYNNWQQAKVEAERANTASQQAKAETERAEAATEQARNEAERAELATEKAKDEAARAEAALEQAKSEAERAEAATEQAKSEAERATTANQQATRASIESEARRVALEAESVRAQTGDDKALALAWLALPKDSDMQDGKITNEAATAIYSRYAEFKPELTNLNIHLSPSGNLALIFTEETKAKVISTISFKELANFNDISQDCLRDYTFSLDDSGIFLCTEGGEFFRWSFSSKSKDWSFEFSTAEDDAYIDVSTNHSYLVEIRLGDLIEKDLVLSFWDAFNKKIYSKQEVNSQLYEKGEERWSYIGVIPHILKFDFDERYIFLNYENNHKKYRSILFDLKLGKINKVIENMDLGRMDFSPNSKKIIYSESYGADHIYDTNAGFGLFYFEDEELLNEYLNKKEKIVLSHGVFYDNYRILGINGSFSEAIKTDAEGRGVLIVDLEKRSFKVICSKYTTNFKVDGFLKNAICLSDYSESNRIEIFDLETNALKTSIYPDDIDIFGLSGNGSLMIFKEKGILKLFNYNTGKPLKNLMKNEKDSSYSYKPVLINKLGSIVALEIDRPNTSFGKDSDSTENDSLYSNRAFNLWDVGNKQMFIFSNEQRGEKANISPDGNTVVTLLDGNIVALQSLVTGQVARRLTGHTEHVASITFNNNGKKIITGAWDNTAKIWDTETGKLLQTLQGHESGVSSAAFSSDEKYVLTASHDASAKLWDIEAGKVIHNLVGHTGSIVAASFSPDGSRLLTASTDATAKVWDINTGQLLNSLEGHQGSIFTASFSPDGTKVVTASEDYTAKIWDIATGGLLATLDQHKSYVNDASWSQQGNYLVTASEDKQVILWETNSFKPHAILKGHAGAVRKAKFSADAKQLATIADDQTFKLWDVETGALLATYEGHQGIIHDIDISPDGRQVVTSASDNTVRVWKVFPGSLKERIAEVGQTFAENRPLTKDECERYGVVNMKGADVVCQ
ncbi:MAG: TIR domain-containing protein [Thiolinea sp.]